MSAVSNKRIDLKIGFFCNNHCAFCVQGDKRERYDPKPDEEIERILIEGKKEGASGVVFTGGEPTIHKSLLKAVRRARDLGYQTLQVQTNGRRFSYPDFCLQLIDAGITEFGLSLHGSTAKIHDGLTEAPGSFLQTVAGIRNLKGMDQFVLTNSVITTSNYRDLPELAKLLVLSGVDQYQFAFVHIAGTADKNKEWLVPRKSDAEPYVKKGLDVGIAAGRFVMTEAIPFCLMKGYERYVAETVIPETTVYDAEVTIQNYTKTRREEGKTKGPDCKKCVYDDKCEGPWKEYPEIFGWDEFRPVTE